MDKWRSRGLLSTLQSPVQMTPSLENHSTLGLPSVVVHSLVKFNQQILSASCVPGPVRGACEAGVHGDTFFRSSLIFFIQLQASSRQG